MHGSHEMIPNTAAAAMCAQSGVNANCSDACSIDDAAASPSTEAPPSDATLSGPPSPMISSRSRRSSEKS